MKKIIAAVLVSVLLLGNFIKVPAFFSGDVITAYAKDPGDEEIVVEHPLPPLGDTN